MNQHDRLERKLDLILQKFEINPARVTVSEPEFMQQVRALASRNKIEAIKLYREATGVGLKEAKDLVDALGDQMSYGGSAPAINVPQLTRLEQKIDLLLNRFEIPYQEEDQKENSEGRFYEQIYSLLRANNKIEAIKVYREATGLGLREAKDAVEAIERELKRR